MNLKTTFATFFLLSFATASLAQKKAVIILLDGIPADVFERVDTPVMDQIAAEGGYTRAIMGGEVGARTESPTISAVGYTSLMTGTWANKHNVYGNDIEAPNYRYWTIFRMMKEGEPESKLGIFSTWEDNRTKILGEGLKETNYLQLDFVFDGYEKDTVTYPHDAEKFYLSQIDEFVSSKAAETIVIEGPDLSWVYLEYTDAVGHKYGDSEEMDRAVQLADQQVKKIWEAIQKRRLETGEDWLIWITTDHGRTHKDGKGHGGQSTREREIWFVTNAQNLNANFSERKPEMVDVVPSLIEFLELNIPKKVSKKLDGVSLIGK
ncbi:alkaline phosphatase family protein [Algoriphagus namhaensis]|uniref:Alkaline phosphatase family protein n=1 Tax=Algoriphagus namhaensis TaxID=915353 RepID=A0ABV8ASH6_9BACT